MTAFDEVMVMGTSHFSQGGHLEGSRFSGTDVIDAEELKIYSYVPQTSAGVHHHGRQEGLHTYLVYPLHSVDHVENRKFQLTGP